MDAEWTASALFSPSKARVQQAQAKDWAAVEAWISKKYGARIPPPCERNEDTLQALLTLANVNESADEQRSQVERIGKAGLASLTRKQGGLHEDILRVLQAELANETHLDALAETVVALDCANGTTTQDVARQIVLLNTTELETKQQLSRTEEQLAKLKLESERMHKLLKDLASPDFEAPEDAVDHTTEWTRTSKTLRAKVAEYDERLSATRPPSAANGVEHIHRKKSELRTQQQRLKDMEVELKAFQELPNDARLARARLEDARAKLQKLSRPRDDGSERQSDGR